MGKSIKAHVTHPLWKGIHWRPVDSLHKGPVIWKTFSSDFVKANWYNVDNMEGYHSETTAPSITKKPTGCRPIDLSQTPVLFKSAWQLQMARFGYLWPLYWRRSVGRYHECPNVIHSYWSIMASCGTKCGVTKALFAVERNFDPVKI